MIYTLDIDHPVTEDNPYDAELIRFSGWKNASLSLPSLDKFDRAAPSVIEFVGNLEHASRFAYLDTWPTGYLLISQQMVRVLEAVRPFRYELFSTRIYSRKIGHLVMDEDTRKRTSYEVSDSSLYTDNFVILKLRDTLDCLDRERTLVEGVPFLQSGEKYLGSFLPPGSHFAFHEPPDGFPPIFLVPELLFYCYSEEAKQACEHAGLRGLDFQPLP